MKNNRRNYVQVYHYCATCRKQMPKVAGHPHRTVPRVRAFWFDGTGHKFSQMVPTKRDGEALIARMTADKVGGKLKDVRAGNITLDELHTRYLASDHRPWVAMTERMYAFAWNHVRSDERAANIADLTTADIDNILRRMTDVPGMQQKLRQLLLGMFKHAVRNGWVPASPVLPAEDGPNKKAIMARAANNARVFTDAELARLVNATDDRFRALVKVLAYVGLRPGEAFGMTVGQVDLLERTLKVDRTDTGMGTKTGIDRLIPLDDDMVATLGDHIARYSDLFNPDALVFPDTSGGIQDQKNFNRRVWRPALKAAGLPPVRLYALRHTVCTRGVEKDVPVDVVAAMTGHSPAMLLSTYFHPAANRDAARAAVERLAATRVAG